MILEAIHCTLLTVSPSQPSMCKRSSDSRTLPIFLCNNEDLMCESGVSRLLYSKYAMEFFILWNYCTSAFFHCVSLSLHYSIDQWHRGLFCSIQKVYLCLSQNRLFLSLCLFATGPWAVCAEGPCHGSFYMMPLLWHYWWLNLYLPQWEKQRHLAHHLKSFYDVVALPELAKLKGALWKTSGTAEPSWKTCFRHNRKKTTIIIW